MHQHRASIAQRFTGRFTGPSGGRVSPTEGRVLGPGEMGQYQRPLVLLVGDRNEFAEAVYAAAAEVGTLVGVA